MASEEPIAAHRAPPGAGARRGVAFCGLGIMGGPMAANLARAGFELSVCTRTREKAERFAAKHGARAAATPREAAEGAFAVITMVPDAPEVEEVLLGEDGAVHGLGGDALAIDMSTIAPTAARAIGERLADDGVAFLEVAAGSAGNSTVLGLKGRPMFERDFTPLFKLEHMLKDVRHCLDEARALGVELRLGSLVEPLYARAADAGHAEEDFAAVILAIE